MKILPNNILDNGLVSQYKDLKDYSEKWADVLTEEEFDEMVHQGYIEDITLGTYNGATDTFTIRPLTGENIYEGIVTLLHDTEYAYVRPDLEEEPLSDQEYVKMMLYYYDVFTLNGRVYVDLS